MIKTKIFLMSFAAVLGSALIGMMLASKTDAANPETVTVEVEFVAPIGISIQNQLQFGLLDEGLAALEVVTIGTDGSVTDLSGRVEGGTQAAADLDIVASPGRFITIDVGTISPGLGYTLINFMCDYNSAGPPGTACDSGGYTETTAPGTLPLLIGATVQGDGTATVGNRDGTFILTITYQ